MRLLKFGEKCASPLVICLGFFDCVHIGHKELVSAACDYAAQSGIESALLTFCNDPSSFFDGERQIYSFEERVEALKSLGLDNIIAANFDNCFAAITWTEFLSLLSSSLNIKAIVVGQDYTFGRDALGNVGVLKEYCVQNGINLIVKPFAEFEGSKISTRNLKDFVKCGNVSALNRLLSEPYFMLGQVEHARHVGRAIGFPTANIRTCEDKLPIADGIYATRLYADGKFFNSMTNVGAKPTFGVYSSTVETYVFDFCGDLYGKSVKLAFLERTRDIIKFSSPIALKTQLQRDEAIIRNLLLEKE